ncbi:MAG: phosphoribosyltransferase family protein [Synechocystis sp.]|nr:phosphoribosyltransferase family protein [Synechocystis sp.]
MTRLINRTTAGKALFPLVSQALQTKFDQIPPGVVMALPRGGVSVATPIAVGLGWPLTLCLVRKLGVPHQPELAFGAIAAPDIKVIHPGLVRQLRLTEQQQAQVIAAEQAELNRRLRRYNPPPLPQPLKDYVVLLVDDGIATGATMEAAIACLKTQNPRQLWVAVPVASPDTVTYFEEIVDRIICPHQPTHLQAIGYWYDDFRQVSDQEVIDCLQQFASVT